MDQVHRVPCLVPQYPSHSHKNIRRDLRKFPAYQRWPPLIHSRISVGSFQLGIRLCLMIGKKNIKLTTNSILKNDKKSLKSNGKGLTFGPKCVPTKTKVGHFLPSIVLCTLSVKRLKVFKHYSWEFQTFIELTVAGNIYGKLRNAIFLVKIRQLIQVLTDLKFRLVILPYPDHVLITKCWPFVNNTSMLSSLSRTRQYIDKIWVKEGMLTMAKIFVGHNLLADAFILIKFPKATDDCYWLHCIYACYSIQ